MIQHGFLRVAAASPVMRVADCAFNGEQILALLRRAENEGVAVVVFPELCLTGYTCADLFHHSTLQRSALEALEHLTTAGAAAFSGIALVGLPLAVDDQIFNCAAILNHGQLLGVVPKSFLPNYKEFYECRWFSPAAMAHRREVVVNGKRVPFGTDRLFAVEDVEGLSLGVEICEDLWVPIPPSSSQALAGATVLVNLSASNEVIGKAAYRRQLVVNQSGRCMSAYIYSSCGVHESTTDVVFGGHCLIAENGTLLAESSRFQRDSTLTVADVDLQRLRADRQRTNSFGAAQWYLGQNRPFERVAFQLDATKYNQTDPLRRTINAHPFVPKGQDQLRERCEDIFHTQVAGLAKRLEHIGRPAVAIGVSGGLDSTLALLVICKTMDALSVSRERILAYTLPGFGTSQRTRDNARYLMRQLHVTAREVDIRLLCLEEMQALNHKPFGLDLQDLSVDEFTEKLRRLPRASCEDLVFENVQARMRTSILMNAGFVIGTGDVSESALGWCTYNGDHMSMYNPNNSIPKTLVKFLVDWAAQRVRRRDPYNLTGHCGYGDLTRVAAGRLRRQGVAGNGKRDWPLRVARFLSLSFLALRMPPEKILYLAGQAEFSRPYKMDELRRWLQVFVRRFFANQFKRSCLPDGPKVGTISLSPRGDWRNAKRCPGRIMATLGGMLRASKRTTLWS